VHSWAAVLLLQVDVHSCSDAACFQKINNHQQYKVVIPSIQTISYLVSHSGLNLAELFWFGQARKNRDPKIDFSKERL